MKSGGTMSDLKEIKVHFCEECEKKDTCDRICGPRRASWDAAMEQLRKVWNYGKT